jgi:hydroxymethylpyrimidine pyrophosphatase-like HAD family hydrolase/energy-coupling factor transporter ATP-binding protein EcfA2
MRYQVIATDYDGTIATDGVVDDDTVAALERLRKSGRQVVLVTGRELEDLLRIVPRAELFDRIVAENGALLYNPSDRRVTLLGEPPPPALIDALRARGVAPLSVGHVILSSWEPHEATVLAEIRTLGLELQVIFNKGAVMVLPPGVNKASGLDAALEQLSLSRHNAIGVGDAENDHAFLKTCECAVAVANALPTVKAHADLVTRGDHGAGVIELIDRVLASDLADVTPIPERHLLTIGESDADGPLRTPVYGSTVMICGSSGSGKSTLASALLEQLAEREYQFCLIDPEGDFSALESAIVLGDAHRAPSPTEILDVLSRPNRNLVVCLLGLPLDDRPAYFQELLSHLIALRGRVARPHWLVLDEAHHLLPATWNPPHDGAAAALETALLITVHPEQIARSVLTEVDLLVAVGPAAGSSVDAFADALGRGRPDRPSPQAGEALTWHLPDGDVVSIRPAVPQGERQRHRRKYAEGTLGRDKSFYFTGPLNRLNLRAQNLAMFTQIAEGIDDETWLYHLRRSDYSQWMRDAIKDDEMADEVARIERASQMPAAEGRRAVIDVVNRRYASSTSAPSSAGDRIE